MIDLSIIIVSWNASEYLRGCLRSIESTRGELVIQTLVVDNCSSDDSRDMVCRDFPTVELIALPSNAGFSRANNIGISKAVGRYIAFVNSDVIVHPGCFQHLVKHMESDHTVGLVGPKILNADGSLQRSCRLLPTLWNTACEAFGLDSLLPSARWFSGREMRHWDQRNQAEVEVLSGCFWIARRAAIEEVGGLDERFFFYAEDVDWCKRFADKGWKICFFPSAEATHFGGGSSSNAALHYSIQMVRANVLYWVKHYGVIGALCYRALSVIYHLVRVVARAPGVIAKAGNAVKFRENYVCLRWLLTKREA